jgi:hypothetical protein
MTEILQESLQGPREKVGVRVQETHELSMSLTNPLIDPSRIAKVHTVADQLHGFGEFPQHGPILRRRSIVDHDHLHRSRAALLGFHLLLEG